MNPNDIQIMLAYSSWIKDKPIITAKHIPSGLEYTATGHSAHGARHLALEGLEQLYNEIKPTMNTTTTSPQEIQMHTNKINTNKLQYLLDKSQEEASEIIQAVSKIRRFGADNNHPERTTTNKQELVNEIEDFLAIIGALESLQYFDLTKSQQNILRKAQALLS